MQKIIFIILFIFELSFLSGQTLINGVIIDIKGNPIIGANIFLENTYDGSFSDENGDFSFNTDEKGSQKLIVSYVTYETFSLIDEVENMKDLKIKLRESVNTLDAVVITAGTFETGDNSKTAVLDPIDVVTTAGAEAGDINSAIQTLPGTSTVGEDGRLFVRGGDANETKVFIDGMRVFKPYTTTTDNVPTRSRFSSFLFKGVAFSSGGYSAEFGDALSGVLSMNTVDEPNQNQTDIGIMTVGVSLAKSKKWKNDGLTLSIGYIDLTPYQTVFPSKYDWVKPYRGISGETVYRHKFKSGLYKLYLGGTKSNVIVNAEDINYENKVKSQIKGKNLYANSTYKGSINDNYALFGGVSYSYDKSIFGFDGEDKKITSLGTHIKTKLTRIVSERVKITAGAEYINQILKVDIPQIIIPHINSKLYSGYTEANVFFSKYLGAKAGLRGEYSDMMKKWNVSPRFTLAYKVNKNAQVSIAAGKYFQTPDINFLENNNIDFENTDQYILNYSFKRERQILRAEIYYKKYNDLLRFDNDLVSSNTGYGHAKGIDIFWKDSKSFKYLQYWLSYSWLDAKKIYHDYPEEARPNSASPHNLSLVAKYWINNLKSYVGITYSYASPRSYNDPNISEFMTSKTKDYNNLSLTWTYLFSQQKILFLSLSNIARFKNEYGYQFARTPDENGIFKSRKITPESISSIFVGFFWTISDDRKANQLDRL